MFPDLRFEPDYNDVEFIKALVNYLVDEYSLDKDHVFCAGFSNGGFMNFRLALEAQDTFLACVSVGGDLCKTLWDKRPDKNVRHSGTNVLTTTTLECL